MRFGAVWRGAHMCHRGASAFAIFSLECRSNWLISDFILTPRGVSICEWVWKVPNGSTAKCTPPKQEWPALFTLTFSEVSKFLERSHLKLVFVNAPCCKGNRLAGTFCHIVHCSKLVFPVFSLLHTSLVSMLRERWRLALCLQPVSSSDNFRDDSMAASV